uniref:trypsin n=1 Tax=Anabas testudineus TaxID=64144 RepID=A0A3Q1JIG5_ANATE
MSVHSKLVTLILALTLDGQVHTGRIYGGHEAVPHSRPYMAHVQGHRQEGKGQTCGGFLLNEDFVMTAAHCQEKADTVLLGLHNVHNHTNVQNISVEQAFPHKDFNTNDYTNDIMLLKLSSKAQINKNVKSIPLADKSDDSLPKSCTVCGWGRTSKDTCHMSPILMEVNVTLTEEPCKDHSYCSKGEKGPRQGDSGGPLVCEDGKVFGVVSTESKPDSDDKKVYAYTKIPDYVEWIESVIKKATMLKFM